MGNDFTKTYYVNSCQDNCTHIIVIKYPDYDEVDIGFFTSYIDSRYVGFIGFFRRVWHAIRNKPIYHSEVILTKEEYKVTVEKMQSLI